MILETSAAPAAISGSRWRRVTSNASSAAAKGLLGNANANVFNLTGITFTTLSAVNGLEGNDQFTGSEFNDWFIGSGE